MFFYSDSQKSARFPNVCVPTHTGNVVYIFFGILVDVFILGFGKGRSGSVSCFYGRSNVVLIAYSFDFRRESFAVWYDGRG